MTTIYYQAGSILGACDGIDPPDGAELLDEAEYQTRLEAARTAAESTNGQRLADARATAAADYTALAQLVPADVAARLAGYQEES